ncbi:hypothetical protein C7M84_023593 [Penaeus vannamei]|uniref:Uncharacterized protein n=1 Tax=Penaeus vannamei TaxID=6689 RepID=A0A423U3E6_PENVA|nr:hypothetical protein C7M84_023593 [Penaeus vannamei]
MSLSLFPLPPSTPLFSPSFCHNPFNFSVIISLSLPHPFSLFSLLTSHPFLLPWFLSLLCYLFVYYPFPFLFFLSFFLLLLLSRFFSPPISLVPLHHILPLSSFYTSTRPLFPSFLLIFPFTSPPLRPLLVVTLNSFSSPLPSPFPSLYPPLWFPSFFSSSFSLSSSSPLPLRIPSSFFFISPIFFYTLLVSSCFSPLFPSPLSSLLFLFSLSLSRTRLPRLSSSLFLSPSSFPFLLPLLSFVLPLPLSRPYPTLFPFPSSFPFSPSSFPLSLSSFPLFLCRSRPPRPSSFPFPSLPSSFPLLYSSPCPSIFPSPRFSSFPLFLPSPLFLFPSLVVVPLVLFFPLSFSSLLLFLSSFPLFLSSLTLSYSSFHLPSFRLLFFPPFLSRTRPPRPSPSLFPSSALPFRQPFAYLVATDLHAFFFEIYFVDLLRLSLIPATIDGIENIFDEACDNVGVNEDGASSFPPLFFSYPFLPLLYLLSSFLSSCSPSFFSFLDLFLVYWWMIVMGVALEASHSLSYSPSFLSSPTYFHSLLLSSPSLLHSLPPSFLPAQLLFHFILLSFLSLSSLTFSFTSFPSLPVPTFFSSPPTPSIFSFPLTPSFFSFPLSPSFFLPSTPSIFSFLSPLLLFLPSFSLLFSSPPTFYLPPLLFSFHPLLLFLSSFSLLLFLPSLSLLPLPSPFPSHTSSFFSSLLSFLRLPPFPSHQHPPSFLLPSHSLLLFLPTNILLPFLPANMAYSIAIEVEPGNRSVRRQDMRDYPRAEVKAVGRR